LKPKNKLKKQYFDDTHCEESDKKEKIIPLCDTIMKITVLTHSGKELILDVDPYYTISRIKSIINDNTSLEASQQKLYYLGDHLACDERTLFEYCIKNNSTIHLVTAIPVFARFIFHGIRQRTSP